MAKRIPVAKILLSDDETYSSKAFQSLLDKYIEKRAKEIRTKREKGLWHKLLTFTGFADERFVDVFGTITENPTVQMHDMIEEQKMTLKLLEEFEVWKLQQPKEPNKKPIAYLKEFLEVKGDLALKA